MRRYLKIMSLACMLMLFTFNGFVSAESGSDSINSRSTKEERAVELNKVIQEQIHSNSDLEKAYAGVYIDDNGVLNINFVEKSLEVNKFSKSINEVKYNVVANSFEELRETKDVLTDKMNELEIRALGLNEKKNKVVVYFQDKLSEESIEKINSIIDPETVEYDIDKTQIKTTANIINGTQSVIGSDGMTVGFAAVNSSGTKGFVTAGHLSAGVGSTAKINGNTVGTLRNKTFGGGVDAAWVEATGSYTPTKTFSNGDTYSSAATDTSNLIQGKTVYAYGSVSGKQTGQILEAYYTVTYNGAIMVDTVKANYKAIPGDSGASVCYYRYVGSASSVYSVMGIQSASALFNNAWVSGTSYTIFTRTDKIFSTLNLSNP